jgi:glycosyltransferase involved in cell wall biosynthesis
VIERLIDYTTPLLITFDEAPNIQRVLAQLDWAKRIVVVDSGSTDGTLELLAAHNRVEVHQRSFDDFASQCNFGLSLVDTDWILSLDADYVLSNALVEELRGLEDDGTTAGYCARFIYEIYGRPLRASLYPPRTVLYRRIRARYQNEGHGHRVMIDGPVRSLRGTICHDDRKPLARWLSSQARYAQREAEHLLASRVSELAWIDRLRRLGWPAPLLIVPYTLILKGCLLDGAPGWYYALQRLLAETAIALALLDRRLALKRRRLNDRR